MQSPPGRHLPARQTEPSPVLDPAAVRVPTERQLPPHRTQVGRVADHLAALSQDMREWTELRIALVQRKVEGVVGIVERLQHYAEAGKYFAPALLLGLVGLVFVFVTLALGLGALIGQVWLGFAIVTLLLLAVAGVLVALGMRSVREAQARVAEARRAAQRKSMPTREELQAAEELSARQSTV
jgi:hypothetical protein